MSIIQDPTFWVATGFVAFFILLAYLKVPGKVTGGLDKRAEKIKADIEEAENLREEAQKLLADYQKRQRDAKDEAAKIVEAAKEEAERLAKMGQERLEHALARREQQATDRLAQAEAAALEMIRTRTTDIAMAATRQILADSLTGAKADTLLDEAIRDLPARLH